MEEGRKLVDGVEEEEEKLMGGAVHVNEEEEGEAGKEEECEGNLASEGVGLSEREEDQLYRWDWQKLREGVVGEGEEGGRRRREWLREEGRWDKGKGRGRGQTL